jgi:hypothetical protein
MSHTDKTDPLRVKQWVDPTFRVPLHDHRDGPCDLPTEARTHLDGLTRCRWGYLWAALSTGLCPCELCHGGQWCRAENRRERRASRRALAAFARQREVVGSTELDDHHAASDLRRW